jgi:VWFA-related protein
MAMQPGNRHGRRYGGLNFLILAIVLSAAEQHASGPQEQLSQQHSPEQTLRVDVNLVTVGVSVTDRKSRTIKGLVATDFEIYEDAKAQRSSFFSAEEQPLSLALLVDKNRRMEESGKLEEAKRALLALVEASHPDTEISYSTYDHKAMSVIGPISDRERVKAAIATTLSESAGTSLYDPIIETLAQLSRANLPRQVLIVISERADQHGQHNLQELIHAVQASLAQVYLVGYFDPEEDRAFQTSGKTVRLITGKEVDNPRYVFKRLAEESGAECFFVKSSVELSRAIETIANELRHQYTLAYHSSRWSEGNGYHRIQVRVKRKGLRVRARHGFRMLEPDADLAVGVTELLRHQDRDEEKAYQSKLKWSDGRITYREDFADSASGWPDRPASFYKDDAYHLLEADTRAANGPWFKNFSASITVELRDGQEYWPVSARKVVALSPEAGLVFRLNESGYYALLISDFPLLGQKQYRLVRQEVKPKKTIELLPWTVLPEERLPVPSRPRYRLGITCEGGLIKVYVNEQPMGGVFDDSFLGGIVGMILTEKGHAAFDDLVVEELR